MATNERPASATNEKEVEVIYTPLDPGDPHETTVGGLKFRANIPTQVSRTHMVLTLLREDKLSKEGNPTGETIAKEKRVPLVDILRNNPFFKVDGAQKPRPKAATDRVPDSPDAYRGYAIAWIASSENARGMDTRWDAEAQLRDRCGCSAEDVRYVRPFFEARREECADYVKSAA